MRKVKGVKNLVHKVKGGQNLRAKLYFICFIFIYTLYNNVISIFYILVKKGQKISVHNNQGDTIPVHRNHGR